MDCVIRVISLGSEYSSSSGGSKRSRPSQVSLEETVYPGLGGRTSSLDTLFRRRRQWSPAHVHNSWIDFMATRDDATVKGSKWKEKPQSPVDLGTTSSSISDIRLTSAVPVGSTPTNVWTPTIPNESGGYRSSRSLPPTCQLPRANRPSVGRKL